MIHWNCHKRYEADSEDIRVCDACEETLKENTTLRTDLAAAAEREAGLRAEVERWKRVASESLVPELDANTTIEQLRADLAAAQQKTEYLEFPWRTHGERRFELGKLAGVKTVIEAWRQELTLEIDRRERTVEEVKKLRADLAAAAEREAELRAQLDAAQADARRVERLHRDDLADWADLWLAIYSYLTHHGLFDTLEELVRLGEERRAKVAGRRG